MVDGAGERDRDVSLTRKADLCLTKETSSLSYGADLDLARSALTGFPGPFELQQPLPKTHVLEQHFCFTSCPLALVLLLLPDQIS